MCASTSHTLLSPLWCNTPYFHSWWQFRVSLALFTSIFWGLRCGKVKEENNIMNVRAHMSIVKVISVPCYGATCFYMRLCQFSLRLPFRARENRKKKQFMATIQPASVLSLGCYYYYFHGEGWKNEERKCGENFCWIIPFRTLIFIGLFYSAFPWLWEKIIENF